MNIFSELKQDIHKLSQHICDDESIWSKIALDIPKNKHNGDISINAAMLLAPKLKQSPISIAKEFEKIISTIPYIENVEIAPPGFINCKIKTEKWYQVILSIHQNDSSFWESNIGDGKKINLEYVSANPTGPLHIGHARGAVYGDVLANILKKCGYLVTKEYYINDSGSQISTLVESTILRYKEIVTGQEITIPEGLYPGDYLKNVAQKLYDQFQDQLLSFDEEKQYQIIKKIALDQILSIIKTDLNDLGIHHDVFFSEQSLHDEQKIDHIIKKLLSQDLIYHGNLPAPKGKIDKNWTEQTQLLFRSTNYDDNQDRVVQKSDKSFTYFAADLAYAQDKIDRSFDQLIYILGADHAGYIKRIKAIVAALSNNQIKSNVIITQLVNFIKNNESVKMSKRSGNFMTVRDVLDTVGKDVIRFMMLMRRADITFDFDFNLVQEQSKNNPVFYVQYAHVRTVSILSNAHSLTNVAYQNFIDNNINLSLLDDEEELQILKLLALWPKILESSAKYSEPHRIAYYLVDLASAFHSLWNLGKQNNHYKFILPHDLELTTARLALVDSIRQMLKFVMSIIGIEPLNKM